MQDILHHLLHEIVTYSALGFEWIGVVIVALSGIRGVIELIKKNQDIDLHLSQGMAVAFQFLLFAGIVKLITIGGLTEIIFFLWLFALYIAITGLVWYELKHKQHERHERNEYREKKLREQQLQSKQSQVEECEQASKIPDSPVK